MRVLFLLGIFASMVSCKKQQPDAGLKITNGTAVEHMHQYPAVVRLATAVFDTNGNFQNKYINCTGVWLSDQVIITAEVCLWDKQYGNLNKVFVTAGALSGSQPNSIVRQSEKGPTPPNAPGRNTPMGLAALLFDKDANSFHVPIASELPSNGFSVLLIGYGSTVVNSSADMGKKQTGNNVIVNTHPFIEIQAGNNGAESGKSLAVNADMGSPIFDRSRQVVGIAVDIDRRAAPDSGTLFNRYLSLVDGAGNQFLRDLGVTIRNLDGQDPLANSPYADLNVKPYDLNKPNPQNTKPNPQNPNGQQPQNGQKIACQNTDFNAAFNSGKPVVGFINATWCGPCRQMKQLVIPDQRVQMALQNVTFVCIDGDQYAKLVQDLRVGSFPTTMKFNADKTEKSRLAGYIDANSFASWLNSNQ